MLKTKLGLIAGLMGAIWLASTAVPVHSMSSDVRIEPAASKTVVKYSSRKHGNRVRKRGGKYVHYYGGYYYATPWWTVAGPSVSVGTSSSSLCKTKVKIVKRWNAKRRVTERVKTRTCI